ncbi:hypothetical protein Taro_015803 [Colocasia esculenta]|uniref:J domain-containing protein n=1 Tax=Colocasia esculenta TaxID=4460 RepID=A0A843UN94_COLES|nr:hypothetical protein [Colocasia esculenta]
MCGTPHIRQAGLLLRLHPFSSSSHPCSRGGLLLLPLPRKLAASPVPWTRRCPRRRPVGLVEAAKREQDHYAVLGVSRRASAADVKKAYRILARTEGAPVRGPDWPAPLPVRLLAHSSPPVRSASTLVPSEPPPGGYPRRIHSQHRVNFCKLYEYHPDVSRDLRAADLFKSIRLAYEVLSDERRRAQYDREIDYQEASHNSRQENWAYDPEFDERRRIYRWAQLRHQTWNRHKERATYSSMNTRKGSPDDERGSFAEVLWSTFCTLFLLRIVGPKITLALSCLAALFDYDLDAGYKMGYITAWFLGGQGGILLTMCISYASWLCGKSSSGLVTLVVLAMWISCHLLTFVPIPRGAIITLLYMSMRLQVDPKYKWGS